MTKRMLIDAVHAAESRVVITEDGELYDYDFVTSAKAQLKGNVFLAKITRVEPSLQAAFVEYGGNRQGFLPFSEIHPDYYQIPGEDKQKLLEEQIAEAEAEEAEEEEAFEREQASRGKGNKSSNNDDDEDDDHEDDGHDEDDNSDDDASESATVIPLQSDDFSVSGDAETDEDDSADESEAPVSASELIGEEEATNVRGNVERVSVAGVVDQPITDDHEDDEDGDDENAKGKRRGRGTPRRRTSRNEAHRRYRINEVIKRNQIVLVQVTKEERGNKGCSLTTYVSLAGRYCVLMPNSPKGGGISRKISDRNTRKRLKDVLSDMRTHRGMSVIIRTAGLDQPRPDIKRDYEYLVKLWNQIREQTLTSSAPTLIYEESDLIKRAIRDLYTTDVEEIVVDGEAAYNDAKAFMSMLMPASADLVKEHKKDISLFADEAVEEMLAEMTDPQVRLPSGGYLVINPTEALISVDVNSGKSTGERNVEDTALKTNIEAAHELARQLRLRDLAGLVVVDFIDMNFFRNRRTVERAMRDALKQDRARIQVGRISNFGLMELSRQRMRPSITETMGVPCPNCKGTGHIHSVETVGMQIVRTLEREAASGDFVTLRVSTYADAALYLLNDKRALLQSLEARYNVKVLVLIDHSILPGHYRLIKLTSDGKEVAHETAQKPRKRNRRGGRNRTRTRYKDESVSFSDVMDEEDESSDGNDTGESNAKESSDNTESGDGDDKDKKPRRKRGSRGGKRNKADGSGGRRRRKPKDGEDGAASSDDASDGNSEAPKAAEPSDNNAEEKPKKPRGRAPKEASEDAPKEAKETPAPAASASAKTPPPDIMPAQAEDGPKRKGWWGKMREN